MRVWVLLVASFALACGEDETVCEEAADKLNACDVGRSARLPLVISRDDCSGENECLAKCVASASCGAIKVGLQGGSTDPNEAPVSGGPAFLGCIHACME